MTSAPVTDWPQRILLVALVVLVIVVVLWAMRRGWRARGERQADVVEPPAVGSSVDDHAWRAPGVYLGSVRAGDWLDRIVRHDLGVRSRVVVGVDPGGIALHRDGARSFSIPATALIGARADRGIAGKAFERGGIVVITWWLGEVAVDSGVRTDAPDDHDALIDAVNAMATPPGVVGEGVL